MTTQDAILQFWFGNPATDDISYATRRKFWFGKHPQFDQAIREQFLLTHQQAIAGTLDHWSAQPQSCLALIIVLDQFSRNMFRDTPQAFAADAKALEIAKGAIAHQLDQALTPIQRIFVYLPFEHSEALADQIQSVHLFRELAAIDPSLSDTLDYALRHLEVIKRFGRFPHRNRYVGRDSTPDELEFLKQPGSSF